MKKTLNIIAAVILYALIAAALVLIIYLAGDYPKGGDTMCHLYKADVLYQNISNGNLYPYYDAFWYNGVQMLRYWAPLPVYFIALCQWIAGGSLLWGYKIFVAMVFFLGAVAWLYIGVRKERPVLGAFMGILWFFMPNNLHALFAEGNLPRSLSMVFLPLFIYLLYEYLQDLHHKKWAWIVVTMIFITLCHSGYAFMIVAATMIYLLIHKIANPSCRKQGLVVLAVIMSMAIIGIWLIPSMIGGISSTDSTQTMVTFFQNFWVTINPIQRMLTGDQYFYFGLAAFLLAVFGILCSHRKSIPGFVVAVFILLCTTTTMFTVLSRLPGSQYMWMLRFISIALCMILYSFLLWDTLKKPFLILVCALLILDVVPSAHLLFDGYDQVKEVEKLDAFAENTLISDAKDITMQRLACMDESSLGAYAPYLISGYGDKKVKSTYGAGWQAASTTRNIVQLNEAMGCGYYPYLFDRCLEMGNDTVLVRIDCLENKEKDIEALKDAALLSEYVPVAENEGYIVFHRETPDSFGVRTEYTMIGIGTSAPSMSLIFPSMEETLSPNLNDYTFEELSKYEIVYLDHFTYDNKDEAEQLIRDLSIAGVKVIISADGMPENATLKVPEFLGVTTNPILFENGYPLLFFEEREVDCNLFADGHSDWSTVYMNGLDFVQGCLWDHEVQQAFLGTKENQNIVFISLNLPYHFFLTRDVNAGKILDSVFGDMSNTLPVREVVPLTITYHDREIVIESDYDNVNTTLAYHDIFESGQEIRNRMQLLYVNAGQTVIEMKYPYLIPGMAISILGIILTFVITICLQRERRQTIHFEE